MKTAAKQKSEIRNPKNQLPKFKCNGLTAVGHSTIAVAWRRCGSNKPSLRAWRIRGVPTKRQVAGREQPGVFKEKSRTGPQNCTRSRKVAAPPRSRRRHPRIIKFPSGQKTRRIFCPRPRCALLTIEAKRCSAPPHSFGLPKQLAEQLLSLVR